jgi:hypothetical protein
LLDTKINHFLLSPLFVSVEVAEQVNIVGEDNDDNNNNNDDDDDNDNDDDYDKNDNEDGEDKDEETERTKMRKTKNKTPRWLLLVPAAHLHRSPGLLLLPGIALPALLPLLLFRLPLISSRPPLVVST